MPSRKVIFQNNFYYHIFNRGVEKRDIFKDTREYRHGLQAANYYQHLKLPLRFSKFLSMPVLEREILMKDINNKNNLLVNVVAYCLMPNHYHFLLQQVSDKGIEKFLSKFSNSYTKFFNTRHERTGHLFQSNFKAVPIQDTEQLVYLSRYIHLNPASSSLTTPDRLSEYKWSSYRQYLNQNSPTADEIKVTPEIVLDQFKSISKFKSFTIDYADYQKKLHEIGKEGIDA